MSESNQEFGPSPFGRFWASHAIIRWGFFQTLIGMAGWLLSRGFFYRWEWEFQTAGSYRSWALGSVELRHYWVEVVVLVTSVPILIVWRKAWIFGLQRITRVLDLLARDPRESGVRFQHAALFLLVVIAILLGWIGTNLELVIRSGAWGGWVEASVD